VTAWLPALPIEQDGWVPNDSHPPTPDSPPQPDPADAIAAVNDATARLIVAVDTIRGSGPDAFAAPSLLPDWTIGHVASHLARNADGFRNVLDGLAVGELRTPYLSPEARAADIEAGARRDTPTIAADFATAVRQLADQLAATPVQTWSATVDLGRGGPTTADVIMAARLGEVELHHHDLGADGGLALLDDAQALRLLRALLRSYVRTRAVGGMVLEPDAAEPIVIGDGGQRVAGSAVDLVGWMSGRRDGTTLRTAGSLPELPSW
jgi:maleylpyruvate isomerase